MAEGTVDGHTASLRLANDTGCPGVRVLHSPLIAPARGGRTALTDYVHLTQLADRIRALPSRELTQGHLLTPDFRLYQRGELEVYFAPFDFINEHARLAIVGITPGFTQMRIAYEATRDELRAGASLDRASRAVKERASFAGMRDRLCGWLDALEVPAAIGVAASDQLFDGPRRQLLHTTSAVRYPVVISGRNYSGVNPRVTEQPELKNYLTNVLAPELARTPEALIVPLGKSVSAAIALLVSEGSIDPERCLVGFPHPSGANAGGHRQFEQYRGALRGQVRDWAKRTGALTVPRVFPATRTGLQGQLRARQGTHGRPEASRSSTPEATIEHARQSLDRYAELLTTYEEASDALASLQIRATADPAGRRLLRIRADCDRAKAQARGAWREAHTVAKSSSEDWSGPLASLRALGEIVGKRRKEADALAAEKQQITIARRSRSDRSRLVKEPIPKVCPICAAPVNRELTCEQCGASTHPISLPGPAIPGSLGSYGRIRYHSDA